MKYFRNNFLVRIFISSSRFRRGGLTRSSHISDLKIGNPVATLPSAWRNKVSAGTGWPCFSVL